jgi:hypothetical protein
MDEYSREEKLIGLRKPLKQISFISTNGRTISKQKKEKM